MIGRRPHPSGEIMHPGGEGGAAARVFLNGRTMAAMPTRVNSWKACSPLRLSAADPERVLRANLRSGRRGARSSSEPAKRRSDGPAFECAWEGPLQRRVSRATVSARTAGRSRCRSLPSLADEAAKASKRLLAAVSA